MVDPTAWANAKLPQQNIATGLAYSAMAGSEVGKAIRLGINEKEVKTLSNSAVDAFKKGDQSTMMSSISRMAMYDSEKAKVLRDTLADLNRTNLGLSAYNLLSAFASKDQNVQDDLLKKSRDALNVGLQNPLGQMIDDMIATPFGTDRNAKILSGITFADMMDIFPKEGKASDRARQLEYELKVRQQEYNETDYSEGDKKWVRDTESAVSENKSNANNFIGIADRMQEMANKNIFSGFRGQVREFVKKFMGVQDKDISDTLTNYRSILLKAKLVSLKGAFPLSDKDMAEAAKGVPDDFAKPETAAKWLRGMAKSSIAAAAYDQARVDHFKEVRAKGGQLGNFERYWEKNKLTYLSHAFGVSEEQFREISKNKGDIPLSTENIFKRRLGSNTSGFTETPEDQRIQTSGFEGMPGMTQKALMLRNMMNLSSPQAGTPTPTGMPDQQNSQFTPSPTPSPTPTPEQQGTVFNASELTDRERKTEIDKIKILDAMTKVLSRSGFFGDVSPEETSRRIRQFSDGIIRDTDGVYKVRVPRYDDEGRVIANELIPFEEIYKNWVNEMRK